MDILLYLYRYFLSPMYKLLRKFINYATIVERAEVIRGVDIDFQSLLSDEEYNSFFCNHFE